MVSAREKPAEKRKVGSSTLPLTTRTSLTCGNADSGNGRWLRSSAGPQAIMSAAAQCPRQREQPAAGAFPLVIGSFRLDPTVEGNHRPVVADERPLKWALVGCACRES